MFGLNWDSREEIVEDGRFFEALRYVELYFLMSQQSLWVSGLVRTAKQMEFSIEKHISGWCRWASHIAAPVINSVTLVRKRSFLILLDSSFALRGLCESVQFLFQVTPKISPPESRTHSLFSTLNAIKL